MEDLNNLREYFSNNKGNSQNLETLLLNNMDSIESLIKFASKNRMLLILAAIYLLNSGFLPQISSLLTGFGGFQNRNRYYKGRNFGFDSNLLSNMLSLFLNGGFNNLSKFNNFANLLKL